MVPVRLSWLVIWFVILSVRTFWIAGSWISGSTVATHRPVSDTSLPAQTPSTATGPSMQPRTMSTMETGVRQLKRRLRLAPPSLAVEFGRLGAQALKLGSLVLAELAVRGAGRFTTDSSWFRLRGYDIRPSRCSPTRMALAMAVRAGFTAPMLGKKLVSTT